MRQSSQPLSQFRRRSRVSSQHRRGGRQASHALRSVSHSPEGFACPAREEGSKMIKRAVIALAIILVVAQAYAQTSTKDEQGVRDFIARWNAAYTSLDSATLAQMETADYEMIDRFGHW